jgi:hypothetical protein
MITNSAQFRPDMAGNAPGWRSWPCGAPFPAQARFVNQVVRACQAEDEPSGSNAQGKATPQDGREGGAFSSEPSLQ